MQLRAIDDSNRDLLNIWLLHDFAQVIKMTKVVTETWLDLHMYKTSWIHASLYILHFTFTAGKFWYLQAMSIFACDASAGAATDDDVAVISLPTDAGNSYNNLNHQSNTPGI